MNGTRRMAWVDRPEHLELRESELRAPLADEVVIKTAYSAVCGSDMHLYRGVHPFVKIPSTIGHELSGYVVAVGENVTSVKVGDLVVPEPILTCGTCDNCLNGNYHMCRSVSYGYRKGEAGYGDYYFCKERWVYKLDPSVDPKEAALVEPLSVAIHGVEKAGELLGKTVTILGAGAIGAFAAAIARAKGASRIFLIDTNNLRLEMAAAGIGAETLNPADGDPVERIKAATGGKGSDVVIECTGVEPCIKQAVEIACQLGTMVQIGISSRPLNNFDYARILQKELTLRGSQGYCFDFQKAINLLSSGQISLSRYVTGVFPFEEINEAFAAVSAPNAPHMKVLVSYGKEA